MNKTSKEKEAEKEAVLKVFAALVRPLTRVAFEYGITASDVSRAVRRAYLQALEARLAEQHRPTTDSRLAVMAGLPVSDVSSLRALGLHGLSEGVSPERVGHVLTTWNTEPKFLGAYGIPLELDLIPTPNRPSFRDLVELAYPSSMDDDALLDALVAAKSVELVEGRTVRCISRAYVTSSADVTRIEQIGRFAEIVVSTFAYNVLRAATDPVYLERAVLSDTRLSETGRDKFLEIASRKGQALLGELDTFLKELDTSESSESGKRYGLGVYFFEDANSDPPGRKHEEQRTGNPGESPTAAEPQEIDVLAARSGMKN